jgi:hypothetical protein
VGGEMKMAWDLIDFSDREDFEGEAKVKCGVYIV